MAAGRPVVLHSQHRSVREMPCAPADYDRVLASIVASALAHQGPDGSLEIDPASEDVGDTSLGTTSLLALAWCRGADLTPDILPAARRSLDFFLRHRVFRRDNPGYPNYRVRHSGVPYARYMLADGEHPFGDWPSTVWALLQAVNVIRLGDGLFTDAQLAELVEAAEGYWTWLTEVTFFNPQDTANQAFGAVVGALMLATELDRRGRAADADRLRTQAYGWYGRLRDERLPDRGFLLPGEHGGAWDGNYGPVSLSFLAQAHRITGDPMFLADGCELARYLDMRLSVRGFDSGGSRYLEQHVGFEGVLGLRYFGQQIGADLGRYLGPSTTPGGHFAFMAVWAMEDTTPWYPTGHAANDRYRLRRGDVSVAFDAALTPHLLDVAAVAVLQSVAERQHGICPLYRDESGAHLLTRPLAPVRSREVGSGQWAAKLVHKALATRSKVLLTTQTLYLTDGVGLHVVVLLDATKLPMGSRLSLLAGLPYAQPAADTYQKILGVRTADRQTILGGLRGRECAGGEALSFGEPGRSVTTKGAVHAGTLSISGNGPVRVSNPLPSGGMGQLVFSSEATIHQTLEQAAFALAADPHGYGNPEHGWQQLHHTNLVEVLDGAPVVGTDRSRTALVVSYTPVNVPPMELSVRGIDAGTEVSAPGLTVHVGDPAGDAHGEPILELS
jgi:hypothetical protein